MPSTLLLYSSVYGLSKKICERIQASLLKRGVQADVAPLVGHAVDPGSYDAIVLGVSIKHGKHHPSVLEFIRANRALLELKQGKIRGAKVLEVR